MKRLIRFLTCLFMLTWGGVIFAAEEEAVPLNYTCRDIAGGVRWHADAGIKRLRDGVYLMVERAEGVYSSFPGRVSWVAEMEFASTKDSVRPIRLDKRVFDAKGAMIRRETQRFDLVNNTATCTHEEPQRNIRRTKHFKFDKDVVTRLSLGFYTKKLLENGKENAKVRMVSEEPNVYEMEISLTGKDTVTVDGRRRAAYRLRIEPRLGIFGFVKVFLPPAYAWHSADGKYEWLRYAGPEGGINSANVEVTVTEK